jgi:hypothetical protein
MNRVWFFASSLVGADQGPTRLHCQIMPTAGHSTLSNRRKDLLVGHRQKVDRIDLVEPSRVDPDFKLASCWIAEQLIGKSGRSL